jgi:carboxymethylenebutenolidase
MGAAVHGGGYVRENQPSPHQFFSNIKAELYFGWPDNDATAPREHMVLVEEALNADGVRYVIDFFPDALHGFAPPDGHRYDRHASEKHWERVHSALRRNLD